MMTMKLNHGLIVKPEVTDLLQVFFPSSKDGPSLKPGLDWTGLNFIFLVLVMFTALATLSDTLMIMISLWNGFSIPDYGVGTETCRTRCHLSEISIQNSASYYNYAYILYSV